MVKSLTMEPSSETHRTEGPRENLAAGAAGPRHILLSFGPLLPRLFPRLVSVPFPPFRDSVSFNLAFPHGIMFRIASCVSP